jgi:sulfate adenylyltransferase
MLCGFAWKNGQNKMIENLIPPYGGKLVNLVVDEARATVLKADTQQCQSLTLTERQLCDLELLMNGAFSPLTSFMSQAAYDSVVETMRLPDGTLWPIPITLDIPASLAEKLQPGAQLALRDAEGFMLAVLHVDSLWQPDKKREAEAVYGTASDVHPGVRYLYEQTHPVYVGGKVEGILLPAHYDF